MKLKVFLTIFLGLSIQSANAQNIFERQELIIDAVEQQFKESFPRNTIIYGSPSRFATFEELWKKVTEEAGVVTGGILQNSPKKSDIVKPYEPMKDLEKYFLERRMSTHFINGKNKNICVVIPYDARKTEQDFNIDISGADEKSTESPGKTVNQGWALAQAWVIRHEVSHCGILFANVTSKNSRDPEQFREFIADYSAAIWFLRAYPNKPWLNSIADKRDLFGINSGHFSHNVGEATRMAIEDYERIPNFSLNLGFSIQFAQSKADRFTQTRNQKIQLETTAKNMPLVVNKNETLALKIAEKVNSSNPIESRISKQYIEAWFRVGSEKIIPSRPKSKLQILREINNNLPQDFSSFQSRITKANNSNAQKILTEIKEKAEKDLITNKDTKERSKLLNIIWLASS